MHTWNGLIHLVIKKGDEELFEQLLAHPEIDLKRVNKKGLFPILLAAQSGKWDYVKKLASKLGKTDINDSLQYQQVIELASKAQRMDVIIQLVPLPKNIPAARAKRYFLERSQASFFNRGLALAMNNSVSDKGAVAQFRLAAEQNDPKGQYCLAIMLAKGRGVDQNKRAAEELFGIAAKQGIRNVGDLSIWCSKEITPTAKQEGQESSTGKSPR